MSYHSAAAQASAGNQIGLAAVAPLVSGVSGTVTLNTTATGGFGVPFDIMPPTMAVTYCVCTKGLWPGLS